MTREEALNILHNASVYHPDYLDALNMAIKTLEQEPVYYPPCIDCNKKMDEIRNAYDNMIIKALEQEPILDKVRIEIEQNAYPIVHGVNNHELGMTLYGILQVIDKYRAEIEPQESEVSDADNN